MSRIMQKTPFGLILVIFWLVMKYGGFATSVDSVAGVILILACFVVVLAEFMKSGDITLKSFGIDVAYSVLTVIVGTVVMTTTIMRTGLSTLSIPDGLVCLAFVVDALLGPINSFRIAQRNFGVGGAPGQ